MNPVNNGDIEFGVNFSSSAHALPAPSIPAQSAQDPPESLCIKTKLVLCVMVVIAPHAFINLYYGFNPNIEIPTIAMHCIYEGILLSAFLIIFTIAIISTNKADTCAIWLATLLYAIVCISGIVWIVLMNINF
jgi:hypothetical protein